MHWCSLIHPLSYQFIPTPGLKELDTVPAYIVQKAAKCAWQVANSQMDWHRYTFIDRLWSPCTNLNYVRYSNQGRGNRMHWAPMGLWLSYSVTPLVKLGECKTIVQNVWIKSVQSYSKFIDLIKYVFLVTRTKELMFVFAIIFWQQVGV